MQFPKSVRAYREYLSSTKEKDQKRWKLGDALLEECGPPSEQGIRDGSREKLQQAHEEIVENCPEAEYEELSVKYLARLREASYDFPLKARHAGLSWSAHEEAGDSDTLNALLKRDQKLTQRKVRNYMQKKRLRDKVNKNFPRPKPSEKDKKKKQNGLDMIVLVSQASVLAGEAQEAAEKFLELVQPHLKKLDTDFVDGMLAECIEVIDGWQKVLTLMRSVQSRKSSHIQEVKSEKPNLKVVS